MNILRGVIAIVLVIAIAGTMMLLTLNDPIWQWASALAMAAFSLAALLKAVHLGPGTLRGKFHIILGSGGATFTAAIVTGLLPSIQASLPLWLHVLSRFILIISVLMMFLGLIKQGYALTVMEAIQVLLVFAVLAGISLWLFYGLYGGGASTFMTILIYLSLLLLIEIMLVVRIYLGSSMGIRWTAGAVSVMFVTLGDMAMAYQALSGIGGWVYVQYLSWVMLALIMGVISLMWD